MSLDWTWKHSDSMQTPQRAQAVVDVSLVPSCFRHLCLSVFLKCENKSNAHIFGLQWDHSDDYLLQLDFTSF